MEKSLSVFVTGDLLLLKASFSKTTGIVFRSSKRSLVRKLSAVGFEEEEISKAIGWLTDLAETTNEYFDNYPQQTSFSFGVRIYAQQEMDMLGTEAVGFIQFLESAKIINPIQREIIIERALAVSERQMSLDKLKVIVLMVLWSQCKEPDGLIFDELFSALVTHPAITAAAGIQAMPFSGNGGSRSFDIEGRQIRRPEDQTAGFVTRSGVSNVVWNHFSCSFASRPSLFIFRMAVSTASMSPAYSGSFRPI